MRSLHFKSHVMLHSRQRLPCVVLSLGLLLAVMCISNWMLDAANNSPHGHPMVGGHLREELGIERALDSDKQQQSKAVTSMTSSPKATTITSATTTMTTELTTLAAVTPKVTEGTRLRAVPKTLAKVVAKPVSGEEALLNKKLFYSKLSHLFGIPLKDCYQFNFTERSCHEYKDMRFFTKSDEMYKPRVVLASYPGSGNTWLRLVLEDTTGVFTGSVYNDKTLRCTGFIGEGQKDFNAVLAVKTHDPIGEYDAAILLIRNPYRAMMSYHTWKVTKSHVIRAETQDMTIPPASFEIYFNRWVQLWSFVVWNTTVPYHIVEYEELQTNLEETLMGMLNFLQVPVEQEKLQCVLRNNYEQYHRPPVNYPNPFSEEQQKQIEGWISEHSEELEKLSVNYKAWVW